MDFLKKHYEKVLLGVVLLGLAVAVAFLPFKIASDKQDLENKRNTLIHPKVKELTNLNLTLPDAVLKRMATPAPVDFSAPNKLFNPMPWQKAVDGRLIKVDATNVGPNAVTVTKMTPLYLKLSLNEATVMDSGVRCKIGVEDEAAPNLRDRKKEKYCKLGDKNEVFALRDISLTKIESRPMRGRPWEYVFFVDLLRGDDEAARNALHHLGEVAELVKVLGIYPPA